MKILFFGDIFGKPGRDAIKKNIFQIKEEHKIDFTIANAENCTHGKGLSLDHYNYLVKLGIDFFTMGNHTWAKNDIREVLKQKNIVRPANLNNKFDYYNDGVGTKTIIIKNKKIRITNILGVSVAGMNDIVTNSFYCLDNIIKNEENNHQIHIVDLHAETTSEKNAFGVYFDGKVSAILGTHTHVPTNDLRISPKGTIYITDVGMCGPGFGSVIGAKAEMPINKFLNPKNKFKLEVSNFGWQLNAVVMEFDDLTNKPISCKQIRIINDDKDYLNWEYQKNNN
ncbi:TIGR00282 family metallophosphoesterase [Mycoplasmoides pirum]|uniref:TIGR00282 family metallophosphoesterase n=1 Tax=Mycoplasmoides pirum TaxID=2122 RepID=UPI0004893F21|nr:TIGR00282 family metallophosphoesterase [Mycoplasmoides pirum]